MANQISFLGIVRARCNSYLTNEDYKSERGCII